MVNIQRKLREITKIRRFQLQELSIAVHYDNKSLFDIPIRDTKGHTYRVGFLGWNSGRKRSFYFSYKFRLCWGHCSLAPFG